MAEAQTGPYKEVFTKEILDIIKERFRPDSELLATVQRVLPDFPPPPRENRAGAWHFVAFMIAVRIVNGYQDTGIEPPSRGSRVSPLVLAVQALLKWIGKSHEADAIRKALGKD
jgi:hypothetical protein